MLHLAMIGPVPETWGGLTAGGGVATHVQGLVSVLPQHDIRVRLLADNTDASERNRLPSLGEGVEIQRMVRPRSLRSLGDIARLGFGRTGRIAWKIVSSRGLRSAAPPTRQLRFLGQAANFDRFLAEQSGDILHVHHAEYRQYLCQQVLGTQMPFIATVHSVNVLVRPHPGWLVSLVTANYRRADRLIAVSNFVKDAAVQHGADPERIEVIPNGVDTEAFRFREAFAARIELGLQQDGFTVLFTGNLIPRKGVDILLRAVQRCAGDHPELHLVLIGQGPEQESLARLAEDLGIADQVLFAGYKPITEMPSWYQACDVFAMPSWAEGLSVSVLEAMSCGKPIVTTLPDIGEHDAVRHGQTGLLVDYGNVERLAQALDQLASSPGLAHTMGAAARRLVEQEFSWDIVGRKTVEVYRTLLAEKTR